MDTDWRDGDDTDGATRGAAKTTGNRGDVSESSRGLGAAVLPTDNTLGIPVLRLDMQATQLDAPFCRWGRERRKSRMRGTWHFYTADERFARLWQRPDLTNSGCVAAVECNFSVHEQTPAAVAIYQTYRKRWLARTWQDRGVRLFVDLNVAAVHAETNMMGVPRGWRAYANRGSVERLAELEHEYELARDRADGADVVYVVYGGGKAVRDLCWSRQWIWQPEEADMARGVAWAGTQESEQAAAAPRDVARSSGRDS